MSIRSIFLANAFVLALSAPAFAASPYTAIYSFGDSLSDAGNVYIATQGAEPAAPYSAGRYSNGPVWTQDVASALGLGPLTPSLLGGNDYAWGGATTGYGLTSFGSPVPDLGQQIAQYSADHGGVASSTALYTLSIGANDLFGILAANPPTLVAMQLAASAAATVAADVAALQAQGAKYLELFDVPDLGKVPALAGAGAAGQLAATELSAYFDQQVIRDIAPLAATGLKIRDLNAFALIDATVADPAKYGFSDVTNPCYTGGYGGGGSACASPNSNLFWDYVHPTEHAQAIIADHAVALALAVPEPSTWALLLSGFAGLGFAARRRQLASSRRKLNLA